MKTEFIIAAPMSGSGKTTVARHQAMLRQVCLDLGLHCLACIPQKGELEQGERYLGLDFSLLS